MARRARSRRRSRPRVRTRTRTVVKWRNRVASAMRGGRRRRRSGGGGGGLPFRSSGGIASRLSGSFLPVVKTVAPIVVGAVGGAMLARALAPKLNTPLKVGAAVTGAAILAGSFAPRFARGHARLLQFVAVGMAADGVMRMLAQWRASGRIPALNTGREGLLAGIPSTSARPPATAYSMAKLNG